jgi:hypothetical protein
MMTFLTKEQVEYIDKGINIYNEIVKVGIDVESKFKSDEYEDRISIRMNFFTRFIHCIESAVILLKEFEKNPYVETSIGLIIRASLLDLITLIYLDSYWADITPDDDKSYNDERDKTLSFLCDHLRKTFKYLNTSFHHKKVTKEQRKVIIDNSYKNYPALFKKTNPNYGDPASDLIMQSFPPVSDMIKRIYTHKVGKNFSNVPDMYEYYGKYEHFGIYTNEFQTNEQYKLLDNILFSIDYIIRGAILCSISCSKTFEIENQISKLNSLLDQHHVLINSWNDIILKHENLSEL